jgi:hypothetical protein
MAVLVHERRSKSSMNDQKDGDAGLATPHDADAATHRDGFQSRVDVLQHRSGKSAKDGPGSEEA